jgi:thiol-disulfide isomerase/thioredoxin
MKTAVVAVIAVAAMAAGAALYLYRQPAPPAQTPPSPFASDAPRQLVEMLPEFQLADREGQMRSLQSWPDKALIVNFWATWCAPCRREIPLLQQLQRDHADEGFQVVGIAVDFRDKVLAYADEMQIEYPLLIGEQDGLDAAASFGIEAVGFPFTVFSDRRGRIVTAHLGELTAAEASLILDAVRQVDQGTVTPEQARAGLQEGLRNLPDAPSDEE